MLATNLCLVMVVRQHTKLTTMMKIVPMKSYNHVQKKIPSKAKKVAIKSSKPNLTTTLKSNSKTTTKSFGLSGEKVNSSTLQMNVEEHLHKRMYVMFVFARNNELSSFVCGIGFFCFLFLYSIIVEHQVTFFKWCQTMIFFVFLLSLIQANLCSADNFR